MRTVVALFAAASMAASCHHSCNSRESSSTASSTEPPPPPSTPAGDGTPRIILHPDGAPPFTLTTVEIQSTPEARERGLMRRTHLDETAGMIFVFPVTEHQVFWMHDTYLPLDMIFITPEHRVLGVVENATPMTDDERGVDGGSQYVLEVRAGFAQRHHITAGTTVEFVNIPPALE